VHSTNYVIGFILILTTTVAVALTGLREGTKEKAALNEEIFNKRAILAAVNNYLPGGKSVNQLSDKDVLDIFDQNIVQVTLNAKGDVIEGVRADKLDMGKERKKPEQDRLLPLFVYQLDGKSFYILAVRGNGLWDEIWGNIALGDDLNTIAGVSFDHKGETPGLGAEIKDNPAFGKQFEGKKIYDGSMYKSVAVVKGGVRDQNHQVDGISGATITGDGVGEMMFRGIKYYEPYLATLGNNQNQ
jgi:Na+-transporting NADH:ubiquinone oxidoreductase subunit C